MDFSYLWFRLYKKLTNYTHLSSVNDDRKWINNNINVGNASQILHQHAIDEEVKPCDGSAGLNNCKFIEYLINMLKSNKESDKLINKKHLNKLSKSYDHLIRCHHIFKSVIKQKEISKYIIKCVNNDNINKGCINLVCPMVINHIQTRRENVRNHGGMDSLKQFLKKNKIKNTIHNIFEWFYEEQYDSEAIIYDFNYLPIQSNIYNKLNNLLLFNLIKDHMNTPIVDNNIDNNNNHDNFNDIMAKRIFNSVHTYLIHSPNQLYRTKNQLIISNQRYTTPIVEQQDNNNNNNVDQIDFGQNVLQWLSYNESQTFSTFKEEIINNPASTISEERYIEYKTECDILCKCVNFDILVKELMALKLYTDTTQYQSSLRRAFWLNASRDEKRNFYQWAISLYQVFQRYSSPIPIYDINNPEPMLIYHGLNKVFAIKSGMPLYNGIFSTTTSIYTASSFSNNTGLLWTIKGSYCNRFKQMIGIQTDWFSQFKNECEFIVFNSYIPIQNTTMYAQNNDDKINTLIKQLIIYTDKIVKPQQFYNKIGFRIKKEWKNKILNHRDIFSETAISDQSVLQRIINELTEDIFSENEELFLEKYENWMKQTNQFVFNSINIDKTIKVSEWKRDSKINGVIQIYCKDTLIMDKSGWINANGCGYSNGYGIGKGEWMRTYKYSSYSVESERYQRKVVCGGGGYGIKGESHSDLYGKTHVNGGKTYGNKKLDILYFGSPSGYDHVYYYDYGGKENGGGIIEIIADKIINRGKITSNGGEGYGGSGGSIKIICNTFINTGYIEANGANGKYGCPGIGKGGFGRIYIECFDYKNEGIICPMPYIKNKKYNKNTGFTPICAADKKEDNDIQVIQNRNIKRNVYKEEDGIIDSFYEIFYYTKQPIFKYKLRKSLFILKELKVSQSTNIGILQIYAKHSIIIESNGHINADYVGSNEYGIGRGEIDKKNDCYGGGSYGSSGETVKNASGGKVYGDCSLNRLYFGSPSGYHSGWGGGGVVEIIAEQIINSGKITSNGKDDFGSSGGSILFRCKQFINNGLIEAKGGKGNEDTRIGNGGLGRIAIHCEKYTLADKSIIYPKPFIDDNKKYIDKTVRFTPVQTMKK